MTGMSGAMKDVVERVTSQSSPKTLNAGFLSGYVLSRMRTASSIRAQTKKSLVSSARSSTDRTFGYGPEDGSSILSGHAKRGFMWRPLGYVLSVIDSLEGRNNAIAGHAMRLICASGAKCIIGATRSRKLTRLRVISYTCVPT